jgi:HD-like signal output (HDOD) protein
MLCQQLAIVAPFDTRGLLHNFGYVLLGHLVPREFAALNRLIVLNPDVALTDLERHVMGVGHEQVGAWLTEAWGLPKELAAASWHHMERYGGEHAPYVQLVLTADRLLKRQGMGDSVTGKLPYSVMQALGISEEQALLVAQSVSKRCPDLDAGARRFAS